MSTWPDEKIWILALRHIRERSMDPDQWLYTRLGEWDERIAYDPHAAERPLVVTFVSTSSWSVFTTRRIAGSLDGSSFNISPLDVVDHRWGTDPKAVRGESIGTAELDLHDRTVVRFEFEAGKAWMGPIHAIRFWMIKHPVLDNLTV